MPALASGLSVLEKPSIPEGYRPSEDEPFMNERQLEYFRPEVDRVEGRYPSGVSRNLIAPCNSKQKTILILQTGLRQKRTARLELRTRDRQRKLISKIEAAIRRIDDNSYGYCEDTGEPIGLARLDARPIATLSLEAQERHERRERVHRDD